MQKGERLIVTKSGWIRRVKAEVSFTGRRKYEKEGKSLAKLKSTIMRVVGQRDSEAGDLDKES